jgi:hypothetical protein
MRDRHVPRLCRSCHAPMARQEDGCWRCGAPWASEDVAPTTLRVMAGGQRARPAGPARASARVDEDRCMNEGGRIGSHPRARCVRSRRGDDEMQFAIQVARDLSRRSHPIARPDTPEVASDDPSPCPNPGRQRLGRREMQ